METVSLRDIKIDERYIIRPIDEEYVEALTMSFKDASPENLPPLYVNIADNGKGYVLVDGQHRYRAFTQIFGEDTKVKVVDLQIEPKDELLIKVRAYHLNNINGKKLTKEELINATITCLKIDPEISNEDLAQYLVVTIPTAMKYRRAAIKLDNNLNTGFVKTKRGRKINTVDKDSDTNDIRNFVTKIIHVIALATKMEWETDEDIAMSIKDEYGEDTGNKVLITLSNFGKDLSNLSNYVETE